MNCNDIVCHDCKLSKGYIQAVRHPRFDVRLIHNRKRIPQWRQIGHLENYVAFPSLRQARFTLQQNIHVADFLLEVTVVRILQYYFYSGQFIYFWIKNEGVFNKRKEVHDILLLK